MFTSPLIGQWVVTGKRLGFCKAVIIGYSPIHGYLVELIVMGAKMSPLNRVFLNKYPTWYLAKDEFTLFSGNTQKLEALRCLRHL